MKKLGGDISDTVSDIAQDAKETGRKIYEQGYEKIKTGKDKISEAFEDGKKVFEQYRDESKDEWGLLIAEVAQSVERRSEKP